MIDLNLLNKLFKSDFDKIKWSYLSQESPVPIKPIVTQSDASNGYIYRYFVKLVNSNQLITEVDKAQYESLKENPRFVTYELRWKIVGRKQTATSPSGALNEGVADINKKEVMRADLTIKGIRSYIIDYTEFWVGESI
jgi:hypothetical protein